MRYIASLAFVATGAIASANSLTILNPSFEAQTLAEDEFITAPDQITHWSSTAIGFPARGIWNSATIGKHQRNTAFVYTNNIIAQQLSATLLPNRTYTLTYLLGRTSGPAMGTVELWVGGTLANGVITGGRFLAFQDIVLNTQRMNEYSMVYHSSSSSIYAGLPISIRLLTRSTNQYVNFDNIRLSVDSVPEPASMLALGAGAVALLRRRKRN